MRGGGFPVGQLTWCRLSIGVQTTKQEVKKMMGSHHVMRGGAVGGGEGELWGEERREEAVEPLTPEQVMTYDIFEDLVQKMTFAKEVSEH